ncbi:MAG: SUF system NifU family Fe-S cluster assembly protein [Candidatus Omnitrophica bacterium]|nr:SUF system NifU family Fe-S cluster assembly protein [Candidatus Omnitrophota bacterium]
MVEQLDELYREVILDHFRSPRNVGELPGADISAEGNNPLCGDQITFWLALDDGKIRDARFVGKGCAISQAAGSMFTEQLKGKTLADVSALIAAMKALMQGQPPDPGVDLGDLESLVGVRKFPVRVKCAALSWNVVEQGLTDYTKQS